MLLNCIVKCSSNYQLSNRIKAKIEGREPPTELPEEDETTEYIFRYSSS